MAQNVNAPQEQYHNAKQWEIALFSLNNSASNLYLFAFGFLTYYATGVAGFATLTVSSLLGAARLFDGLIDPMIGVIMDHIDTKWGRFRPIMIISNIGLLLSFALLFSTHQFDGSMKYGIYFLALIFHKIVYSFQQTVTKAAQPVLTNNPKQRPLFSVYDTIFSSIGIFSVGQMVVANWLSPRHGGEFNLAFFTEFIIGICVISFVLTILAMIGISRKDNQAFFGLGESTVETKSIKDYWSVIKGNGPLQILALTSALVKFLTTLIGDQVFVVLIFGIILGNYGISGTLGLIQIIPNLLIVAAFTTVASRTSLKNAYILSLITMLTSVALMGVILFTAADTREIFANGGLAMILFSIGYIGFKIAGTYPTSVVLTMAADISDYETARSGRFVSGLIGTVFSLTDSISTSLAPIVIGWLMIGIGYTDAYPGPDEALSPALFTAGTTLLIIVPAILGSIALFLISRYPLNKQKMIDVQAQISARKG